MSTSVDAVCVATILDIYTPSYRADLIQLIGFICAAIGIITFPTHFRTILISLCVVLIFGGVVHGYRIKFDRDEEKVITRSVWLYGIPSSKESVYSFNDIQNVALESDGDVGELLVLSFSDGREYKIRSGSPRRYYNNIRQSIESRGDHAPR